MLRYLGLGERHFARFPVKPIARVNWEFFAVVQGECAPLFDPTRPPALLRQTLWVFPPGSTHSWAGAAEAAEVAVFHFGSVPAPLATAVREHTFLTLPLTEGECHRLGSFAQTLQQDFDRPTRLSNLVFQSALLELTLLALRKLPEQRTPLPAGHAKEITDAAITWFVDNVRNNPAVDEVSRRLNVSPSTLRRAFQQTLKERPVRVFARLRMESAMRLMSETTLKLDTIAGECGFSSTTDFCRAFKNHVKVTPSVWRRTLLAPPRAAVSSAKLAPS